MAEARDSTSTRWAWLQQVVTVGPLVVSLAGGAVAAFLPEVIDLSTEQLQQLTLALLSAIGGSLLAEKLVEEKIRNQNMATLHADVLRAIDSHAEITTPRVDAVFRPKRALPPFEDRAEGAHSLAISGGSLFRLTNEYRGYFEQALQRGVSMRFLVTSAEGAGADYLASYVSYESTSVRSYRENMARAIEGIQDLCERFPDSSEIRTLPFAPPCSLIVARRQGGLSTAHVELYTISTPARDRPVFVASESRDPRSFAFFADQFETMWSYGSGRTELAPPD